MHTSESKSNNEQNHVPEMSVTMADNESEPKKDFPRTDTPSVSRPPELILSANPTVPINLNPVPMNGTLNVSNHTTPEGSADEKNVDGIHKFKIQDVEKPKSKCQHMCKQWSISWRSLAPRTRKFLKTAGIAAISAVVLVAIFHLARLAEHPVKDTDKNVKVIMFTESSLEVDNIPQQYLQDLQHDAPAPVVYKDASGKVRPANNKEKLAVIQDMLAKTGSEAGIHPVLGVPVSKDFLQRDVKRLMNHKKSLNKPANQSEVNRTLEIVKWTLDVDRKKMASKELRLWTPGESALKVLLVTTWRSGSTFLGQVLEQHPGVFQHYEPLSHIGIRQVRSGKDAFQAQQLVHRLLDCKYKGLDNYLNYTRRNPQDMLGHNNRVWDACKRGPNRNACFNATFLSDSCKMFPIQLVKSVRLRLNLTQLLLNEEKLNVKVVFLVRDPRAIMSSRYSSVMWCAESPDCASPEALCNDLQGDLKVATAFKQLYPDRFTMVKYEDLAENPNEQIQSLMNFLGMEYSAEIDNYISEHTQTDINKPWSTKRKSSDRISLWKKQLPLQEIHTVQNACESVIKSLGYEMMGQ